MTFRANLAFAVATSVLAACARGNDQASARPQVPAAVHSAPRAPEVRSLPDSVPQVAGPRLQLDEGAFGLSNSDGDALIVLDTLVNPSRFHTAICADARLVPVSYVRYQEASQHTVNKIAANFDSLTGDVYRVVAGSAPQDATCYLSADSALLASAVPVHWTTAAPCDSTLAASIIAAKHRPLVRCWRLAVVTPQVTLAAAQFAIQDTSDLAALVLLDHGQLLFEDFPAQYLGPGNFAWRADDGGEFTPDGFGILFLARVRGVDVMGVTWAAAEGEDAYIEVADSAASFRTVSSTYRYWAGDAGD